LNLQRLAIALILTATALAILPQPVKAVGPSFTEGFESFNAGDIAQGSFYNTIDSSEPSVNIAASFLVASTTLTGSTRALAFTSGTTDAYGHVMATDADINLCTLNSKLNTDLYVGTITSASQVLDYMVKTGGVAVQFQQNTNSKSVEADGIGFRITGTGTSNQATVLGFIGSGGSITTVSLGTITTPGLFHTTLTNVFCTATTTKFTFVFGTLAGSLQINAAITSAARDLYIYWQTNNIASVTSYIDNIAWTGMRSINPYGSNKEDFNSYAFGATPGISGIYTYTKAGAGSEPGILDCDGLNGISSDVGTKCDVTPAGNTHLFHSLTGGFCADQSGSTITPRLVTDFGMGMPAFASQGFSQIEVKDASDTNHIALDSVKQSDGTVSNVLDVKAGGTTLTMSSGPSFNQIFDRLYIGCSSSSIVVSYESGGTHASTTATDFTAPLTDLLVSHTGSAGPGQWVDNINFPAGAPASFTTTVAVTNLVGFSVDSTGTNLLAATTGGTTVNTFAAATLTSLATEAEVCSGKYGFAGPVNVAYPHCSSSTTIDAMRIRTPQLTTPSDACAWCETTLTEAAIINPGSQNQLQIQGVSDFPIDYSRVDDSGTVVNVGFAWRATGTSGDGTIGVSDIAFNHGGTPDTHFAVVSVGSQLPNSMCIVRDPDAPPGTSGKDYIYENVLNENVKGYLVSFSQSLGGTFNGAFQPAFTQIFPGTSATANARGIACGIGHFAILNLNQLTVWKCRTGCTAPILTIPGITAGASNGVTMSEDGKWVSWVDGTTWSVACADTACPNGHTLGQIVATGPVESGTYIGNQLQGAGTQLWIGTSTSISRYDIHASTTGNDTVFNPPCSGASCNIPGGSSSTNSGTGGLLGLNPANLDPTGSGNPVTGGFFEAVLLILGFAVAGTAIIPGRSPATMIWGAGLGAALGFIFTVFLGVMPPVITFIFVFAAIVGLGFKIRNGKDDSAGG